MKGSFAWISLGAAVPSGVLMRLSCCKQEYVSGGAVREARLGAFYLYVFLI